MTEETRERIVAAAYRTLSRKGYERGSIKDIAGDADVAPGLIHYYFDTKEDLLVATVRYACEQMQPAEDESVPDPREAFEIVKATMTEARDFYKLLIRTISVALNNPRIAAEVRDFIREQRADVARVLHDVVAERGGDESTVLATSAAIYGGIIGIVLQDLLEEDFEADAAIDALAWLTLAHPSVGTPEQG